MVWLTLKYRLQCNCYYRITAHSIIIRKMNTSKKQHKIPFAESFAFQNCAVLWARKYTIQARLYFQKHFPLS